MVFSYSDNALRKHHWALRTFEQLRNSRNRIVQNKQFDREVIPTHFTNMNVQELNYALPHFIHEVAKKDSQFYPTETLYTIVMSLQGCLQAHGQECHFLEDKCFACIKNMLDNQMKELSQQGIVSTKK